MKKREGDVCIGNEMERRYGESDQRYGNAYGKKDGNVQGLWNKGVQQRD